MRKWQKPAIVVASVVFFAAMIATLLVSSQVVDARMRAFCFKELKQTAQELAAKLNGDVVTDRSMLRVIAASIAAQGDENDQTLLAAMGSFDVSTSYVSYLEYLRADGRLLHQNGTYLETPDSLSFAQEAAAAPYISNRLTGIFNARDQVIRSAVPVVRGGETIGVLYGIVSLDEFSKGYKTEVYDGEAFVLLEEGDSGDFLLDMWHKTLGNVSDLGGRKALPGFDFAKLDQNLRAGIGGYIGFVSETTGDGLYLYHEPVGINNWNVLVMVEESVAMAQTRLINGSLYLAVLIAVGLLLLYAAFITLVMTQANRMIRKLGMEDQTTQLPNRNAYDSFVKEGRDKTFAAISCVFTDVNGLHEMNNAHGHDAGDQLLRCVADALKEAFKGQRVFRIGGDEFVVFAENLPLDATLGRMKNAAEALARQEYSVSYGGAYREKEQGLDRLIHEADENMLANKRVYYETHSRRKAL